jgi:hypothetical protein
MWNSQAEELRDRAMWWAGALIIVGAVGIGVYYRYFSHAPVPVVQKAEAPPAPTAPVEEPPAIEHPVPQQSAPDTSLPAVNASDQLVHDSLAGLIGARPIEQFLVPESIVRHIVATIDNLPRKKVAVEVRPVKATPGAAIVKTEGDVSLLSEQNYARYAPFVRVVKSIDPKTFADVYFRLYPLFQHAYEDLGYPDKYFNDRLVQAIDDMLRSPEPQGPIQLVQPKVFYELADPDLEDLSAGQKLLIRMGPTNARVIKEKLRALRAEVVKNAPGKGQ